MKGKRKISLKGVFLSLMIFSFSWVVIGDLVAMHIKIIYHVDIEKHFLIIKKVKEKKSFLDKFDSSFGNNIQLGHSGFIENNSQFQVSISTINRTNNYYSENTPSKNLSNKLFGRAPPLI